MKEFLFVFRRDHVSSQLPRTPEQGQEMMKSWQDWMGSIAAADKLVNAGSRLATAGKVVKPSNMVTDGPYIEMKEAVGGYIIVRAVNLDAATELAKNCPILSAGGNVEVREMIAMDDNS